MAVVRDDRVDGLDQRPDERQTGVPSQGSEGGDGVGDAQPGGSADRPPAGPVADVHSLEEDAPRRCVREGRGFLERDEIEPSCAVQPAEQASGSGAEPAVGVEQDREPFGGSLCYCHIASYGP